MLIICPTCSSSYLIRATEIGPEGRLVRCGSCTNSWQVEGHHSASGELGEKQIEDTEIKAENLNVEDPVPAATSFRPNRRMTLGGLAIASFASIFILPFGKIADIVRSLLGRAMPADRFADMDFDQVSSQLITENDKIFLIVEGRIVAKTGENRPMPGLALSIRDESKDQIFRWTVKPPTETISAGAPIPFKVRLVSPPVTGREVLIRFVDASEVGDRSAS